MDSEVAISLRNVSKCYKRYAHPVDRLKEILLPDRNHAQEFWALKDINLEVPKGKTVGIIGRNGSGKSTLLQIIAGTLTSTSGSVEVNGRIGALLELGSGFNLEFTGRENVFLNGAILGLSREEMEKRFDEIAAFADIGDFIDQPVKTYSSGMIVRLAFAVSVNVEPEILIIDEALAVGDAAFQFKCFERLEYLTKSGVTILFVSHDIGTVKNFCEHVLYLANGTERASGPADQIAELYFLDLRDQQKKSLGSSSLNSSVKLKKAIGGNSLIAFGTDEGHIVKAEFIDTGSWRSVFTTGDQIQVKVEVEFDQSVAHPCVSILLQDRRMLLIGGRRVRLPVDFQEDKVRSATILFNFKASLEEGSYFLTTKLENCQTANNALLIDKQVGLLSFEIVRSYQEDFLGIVDFKIGFNFIGE